MKKLIFRTTPELKRKLSDLAKKRGLSVSELVRCILEQYVDQPGAGGPVVQSGVVV